MSINFVVWKTSPFLFHEGEKFDRIFIFKETNLFKKAFGLTCQTDVSEYENLGFWIKDLPTQDRLFPASRNPGSHSQEKDPGTFTQRC